MAARQFRRSNGHVLSVIPGLRAGMTAVFPGFPVFSRRSAWIRDSRRSARARPVAHQSLMPSLHNKCPDRVPDRRSRLRPAWFGSGPCEGMWDLMRRHAWSRTMPIRGTGGGQVTGIGFSNSGADARRPGGTFRRPGLGSCLRFGGTRIVAPLAARCIHMYAGQHLETEPFSWPKMLPSSPA